MSMLERTPGPIDGLPKRRYRVTFVPGDVEVEVDPDRLPYGDHGLPGSILDIAQGHDIHIEHACGGFGVCGTCHVIIREGADSCGEPTEEELDALDHAYGVTPQSRLGCLCVPDGSSDVVVEIPAWNRNIASEGR